MNIEESLYSLIDNKFGNHPFSYGVTKENIENLLANYLAMSQAFPYIQAGSQANLILTVMKNNIDVPIEIEMTSVVGNFLSWDETGGHHIIVENGVKGLPLILNTQMNFHANYLKKDIFLLLGKNLSPSYSSITQKYLKNLLSGFASITHLERLAYMVAFEQHAGIMIESLWKSLSTQFLIDKDDLFYFRIHVGGSDPAEPYHIEITRSMIKKFIKNRTESESFINYFTEAYSNNFNWCESIKIQAN